MTNTQTDICIASVRETLRENGYAIPAAIFAGEVCWAGDDWILLYHDLAAFAIGRRGDNTMLSILLVDNDQTRWQADYRAQAAGNFVAGRIDANDHRLEGILYPNHPGKLIIEGIGAGLHKAMFYGLSEDTKAAIRLLLRRAAEQRFKPDELAALGLLAQI